MANQCPIVLVHGLFGYGPKEMLGFNYWGQGMQVASPLQRFEASVGPISSAHDRACEVFAQIIGKPVDYGEEHSRLAGHLRENPGKNQPEKFPKGFYPEWSEQNPIHLVGHSLGGPTIRMLQYLLEQDFWKRGTSEKWVKSISGISPVFNGSTLAYLFGCDPDKGLLRGLSGDVLAGFFKLIAGALGSKLEDIYDFDLGQWELTKSPNETLLDFYTRIAKSEIFKGKDNAAYDLTLQSLLTQNALIKTFPGTYYFSYVTEQTSKIPVLNYHWPDAGMNLLLRESSKYMGSNPFFKTFYPGFNRSEWRENDGAVPSYSQKYPRISGNHDVAGEFDDSMTAFEPGKWYWQYLHDRDHLDVAMFPENTVWQQTFYTNLFNRLALLD